MLQVHNEDDRPEAGQALNKPAEVTLLNVYKRDKATGDAQKDPASVDAYVRRLKKLAAKQSSRFLDYDVQGGVWRFEVEHFSRCTTVLLPVPAYSLNAMQHPVLLFHAGALGKHQDSHGASMAGA